MKKITALVMMSLVLVGCMNTSDSPTDNSNNPPSGNDQPSYVDGVYLQEIDGFEFEAAYKGDSKWSYTVKGSVPTPCHKLKADVIIAESFPEQVTITASVTAPAADVVCAQVIDEQTVTGTFGADEEASMRFKLG